MDISVKNQELTGILSNVLVIGIFEDDKTLSSGAKRVDEALLGLISEQIIKKDYPEKEQEALLDIIRMRSDMTTIEGLYRLKKYFPQVHPKESAFLISHVTALSEKELDALLAAENTEELTALLQKTRYGKLLDFSSEEIIEKKTRRALLRQDEKNLRFSTYPQVTLLSYIGILNVENTNLTHISEGIGYKETPEEILKYLIVQDN